MTALSGLLFGISPADVTTQLFAGAALAAVAAAASVAPALRAARWIRPGPFASNDRLFR